MPDPVKRFVLTCFMNGSNIWKTKYLPFMRAVICFQVYFEPDDVHACIVTCGGLCPGLNTVIREIVCGLYHMYGVKKVLGIDVSD